jgi:hypothetical protein
VTTRTAPSSRLGYGRDRGLLRRSGQAQLLGGDEHIRFGILGTIMFQRLLASVGPR